LAARVIHFGWDDCYRLAVLQRAGYHVIEAGCIAELQSELRSARYDAIVLSEDQDMEVAEVLDVVRRATRAPVILFRRTFRPMEARRIDLVVEYQVLPRDWLRCMAVAILRHRLLPNGAD
jgi:hypothetical protein